MIIAIVRQALSPAVLTPVLRDAHLVTYDGVLVAKFKASCSSTTPRFRSRPFCDLARPSAPTRGCTSSILPPSAALLDVFRRQMSAVSKVLTPEEIDVCDAPAKWWCPCCRRNHEHANCALLKAYNPCNSCGAGRSHRSCPQRRERSKVDCAPSPKIEEQRPPAVRLPPSSVSDTGCAIKLGDLWSHGTHDETQ
jgi:hypothetical protein